jgi:membrane-associated phospholipid phosphatase
LPLYAAAGFVAYSRVESREHHPRDVIAGAAIGVGSSFLFTRRYAGFRVEPTVSKKSVGVAFLKSW